LITSRNPITGAPRERDYVEALAAFYTDYDKLDHRTRATAYMRQMEQIAQRYGDDREARIFYALSVLATADGLDKTYKISSRPARF